MSQARRRIFDSWLTFCGVATVSFALLGASTVLAIVDAATLNLRIRSWGGISATAAIVGSFALLFIIILTICRLGCSGSWFHRWVLPWSGALVAAVSAVFSISALVLKSMNAAEVKRVQHERTDATGQFALWAVANVVQIVFYAFVMLRRLPDDSTPVSSARREKRPALPRRPTPPTPLRIGAPPFALSQTAAPLSPSTSSNAESKRSSWRDSLVSLRLTNSRIKLLGSRTTLSRGSSIRSAATTHSDAFDSWDTSNVDVSIREAISPTVPNRGTTLETIPGSRPASPLDGPFPVLEEGTATFPPLIERPHTAQSQASSSQQRVKRTFIPAARPMSPSEAGSDESHIHPLFRTDSPTPPPAISRDTIVTASPMGGHVMPAPILPRPASRMRSASQLSSRAASRAGSCTPSHASSMDDLPATARKEQSIDERRPLNSAFTSSSPYLPSSPFAISTVVAESSLARKAEFSDDTRSQSPISRGLTPPIPEFILSARKEGPKSKGSKETVRMGSPRAGSEVPD